MEYSDIDVAVISPAFTKLDIFGSGAAQGKHDSGASPGPAPD